MEGSGPSLDIAPLRENFTTEARAVEGFYSFSCKPTRLSANSMNWTMSHVFTLLAEVGPRLSTLIALSHISLINSICAWKIMERPRRFLFVQALLCCVNVRLKRETRERDKRTMKRSLFISWRRHCVRACHCVPQTKRLHARLYRRRLISTKSAWVSNDRVDYDDRDASSTVTEVSAAVVCSLWQLPWIQLLNNATWPRAPVPCGPDSQEQTMRDRTTRDTGKLFLVRTF